MARDEIVVLGAGIIGLSVALELSKRGYGQHVTVVAEHLPGDKTINYTSPWAGGNFSGISGSDKNALHWDRLGYLTMMDLVERGAEEAKYLAKTKSTEYWDEMPSSDKVGSITEYLRDPVKIPQHELPPGVSFGIRFTTITINAPAHCQHLQAMLSKPQYGGVVFERRKIASLSEAFLSPATQVVFNCIGNAAVSFPGVNDTKCYPTRGQIVLVKAPQVAQNIMRHGKDYETYVIPRPLSDSTVILGGYLQKGNWDSQVKPHETESILKRTGELLPVLKKGETKILGEAVGFRPSREGGARVELEQMKDGGRVVVHNYGAGGTGFQAGLGMAQNAVDLAEGKLREIKEKSRL